MEPTEHLPPEPGQPPTRPELPQPVRNALDAAQAALRQAEQHLQTLEQQIAQHV